MAVQPEVREAHRDVGLGASEGRVQHGRLEQALVTRRSQPEQQLAEGDHFLPRHRDLSLAARMALLNRRALSVMRT
jgi:hypothetical protein